MRSSIAIGVLLFLLLVLFGVGGCSYNKLVDKEEKVRSQWAQVENAYQRRADLIPNLVNTVKGAANFEKETLTAVMNARASATQTKLTADNLTEANLKAFQQAQAGVSSALSRLLVSVEAYPDLKANQNFRDLMNELAGSENRISVERKRFNDLVQDYNRQVRSFPANMMAGIFGFEQKAYFEAKEGTELPPEVKF
ncbi:MAG: LemA family protein [Bacteroidia bacterium]|nr:LemA family protein [Bacteroidia bacterium]